MGQNRFAPVDIGSGGKRPRAVYIASIDITQDGEFLERNARFRSGQQQVLRLLADNKQWDRGGA